MNKSNSFVGGTLIISGTTLGAGLLALPIASAEFGLLGSAVMMGVVAIFMTYMALVAVEINFHFGGPINISSAAEGVLGTGGRIAGALAIMLLYYALLSAYLAGGASTLHAFLGSINFPAQPLWVTQLIILGFLGSMIYIAKRWVDYTNRCLFLLKVGFFLILIAILTPNVNPEYLERSDIAILGLWQLVPLFITSFGYHGSIPSAVEYIGMNPRRLPLAFIIGSLIPLAFYLLWQYCCLGTLPATGELSYESVHAMGDDVGTFIHQINELVPGQVINWASNGFGFIAIATSFLGVGLGLFDFFTQKMSLGHEQAGKMKAFGLTFSLPLVFALFYPQGFIMALKLAGASLTVIAVILPAMIALKLRKKENYDPRYRAPGGIITLWVSLIIGIGIILTEAYSLVV